MRTAIFKADGASYPPLAFYIMPPYSPYCVLLRLATTVSVARGETARAATVVLMIDTHRPLPLPSKMSLVHYSALAAVVNAHYACVHGFDFLYMRRSEPGCTHPRFGRRHPSYCKLPAVAATTMADGRIDSDSWFAPGAAPPIETLVGAAERRLQHAAERRARGACRPNAVHFVRASLLRSDGSPWLASRTGRRRERRRVPNDVVVRRLRAPTR